MGVVPTLRGKVEFDVSEEGREQELLLHLARRATAESWRLLLGGNDIRPVLTSLVEWFDEGNTLQTGDETAGESLIGELGKFDGLGKLLAAVEPDLAESPGLAASCVEFAIEGLWLTRRIDKDEVDGVIMYGAA